MGPQLRAVIEDRESAARRLRKLTQTATADTWRRRPAPASWSAAECVHHLNLMSAALLPRLRAGLSEARDVRETVGRTYRRDLIGWLIGQAMAPSGGLKTATVEAFKPSPEVPLTTLLADFSRLQSELAACVAAANGLALGHVRITSPYDSRVRYNLYSALTLIPRHQHRHLLQAERAAQAVSASYPAAAAV